MLHNYHRGNITSDITDISIFKFNVQEWFLSNNIQYTGCHYSHLSPSRFNFSAKPVKVEDAKVVTRSHNSTDRKNNDRTKNGQKDWGIVV